MSNQVRLARLAAKIDGAALQDAQAQKDAVRAYELVYQALGGD